MLEYRNCRCLLSSVFIVTQNPLLGSGQHQAAGNGVRDSISSITAASFTAKLIEVSFTSAYNYLATSILI